MPSAEFFLRKLAAALDLSRTDRETLIRLLGGAQHVRAGTFLAREGEPPGAGFVVGSGWAVRERLLNDGRRQVITFMLPGDLSDPSVVAGGTASHTITALTDMTILRFNQGAWAAAVRDSGGLTAALWWLAAHEAALLKEHVVALGRRAAKERILYLVWEVWRRLTLVGLATDGTFDFPVSYEILADASGMTPRHLGRVLNGLREDGIIRFKSGTLSILDADRLREACDCRDEHLQITPIPETIRRALETAARPPEQDLAPGPAVAAAVRNRDN